MDADRPPAPVGRSWRERRVTQVAPAMAKRRRGGAELRRRREALTAYLLIAPAFLLFIGFIAGPLVGGFALSLFDYDLLSPAKYVGLANFRHLFHDSVAAKALEVTAVFTLASLVLHLVVGLALALAVNRRMPRWLRYILRTSFFFPVLISWAVVSLIAQYTLDPNFGFIPYYLSKIGIPNVGLFTDPHTALGAIIGVDLWHTVGFTFLVLLAGLQAIPSDLYEAARVDGIGAIRTFTGITLPMLSPSLFFVSVVSIIGAFQIFEPVQIITLGGPGNSTESIVEYIYNTGFVQLDMGYAATLGLVLFAGLLVITLVQFALGSRWVHYEVGD
jgi:multiple sugar transport system permease protein